MEENPDQCRSSLAGCTPSLHPSGQKRRWFGVCVQTVNRENLPRIGFDCIQMEFSPGTHRGAQNTLYVCHFAALQLSGLQKVHQTALKRHSFRCALAQKRLLSHPKLNAGGKTERSLLSTRFLWTRCRQGRIVAVSIFVMDLFLLRNHVPGVPMQIKGLVSGVSR